MKRLFVRVLVVVTVVVVVMVVLHFCGGQLREMFLEIHGKHRG